MDTVKLKAPLIKRKKNLCFHAENKLHFVFLASR